MSAIPACSFYDVKMTRYGLLVLVAAVLLDGCGGDLSKSAPVAATVQVPFSDDEHCRAVARERADDALANGYDFNIEERVYQETSDDCRAWRTRDKPE